MGASPTVGVATRAGSEHLSRVPRPGHLSAVLLALLAPFVSVGGEPATSGSGPVVSARLSGGRSWGDISGDTFPVHEQLTYVTSAGFEGLWRLHPRWDAGLTVELGHAPIAPTICPAGATCWGWLGRAAALVRFHAAPALWLDPWVALGAGVLVADVRIVSTSQRWEGFEVLRLEAGAELWRGGRLSLGPFVSSSLDQFTREVVHGAGHPVETAPLPNRAWHGWVMGGIRGTYEPRPRGGGR